MRKFLLETVNTDLFAEIPCEAQALFFHLVINADEDGFLVNTMCIIRATRNTLSSLNVLMECGFVVDQPDGNYRLSFFEGDE